MKKYANYKDSEVEWIGEIPIAWDMVPVSLLFEIGRGRVISNEEILDNNGIYPVYSSQTTADGIMGYINTFDFEGEYLTWTTDGANAGTVFYRNGKFNCTNVCGTLKSKRKSLDLNYALYALANCTKPFVRLDINPKLMNGVMAKIRIPLPKSVLEQRAISTYLDAKCAEIDDLIKKKEELVRLLELKRQAVINEAVTKGLNSKVKMKDSGVEWIGEVPEHWSIYKGSRIGDFYKGSGVKKDEVKSEGVACIRYGEIYTTYNKWFNKTKSFIDPALAKVSFSIQKGDLLFAASGETKEDIGKCVTYLGTQYAVAGGDIIILRPNNLVDSFYASFLMNSDSINIQKSLLSKGEIIVHLYAKHLRAISYPIPPTEEQAELYNYLNVFSSRVDNIKKSIIQQVESLVEYKKSLIFEVVTGKRVV